MMTDKHVKYNYVNKSRNLCGHSVNNELGLLIVNFRIHTSTQLAELGTGFKLNLLTITLCDPVCTVVTAKVDM